MPIIDGAGGYTRPEDGAPNHFALQLNVPDLTVGTYSIPADGDDDQTPHSEDEIYVVTAGRGTLLEGDAAPVPVGPGDVLYVPAGVPHKFVDITEDLALLVVFGPAYRSRRPPT